MNSYKYDLSKEEVPEALKALIPDFLNDRAREVEEIEEFATNKNYEEIRKITHKWKGFAAPYGFNFFEDAARAISENCKADNSGEIQVILDVLKAYLKDKKKNI